MGGNINTTTILCVLFYCAVVGVAAEIHKIFQQGAMFHLQYNFSTGTLLKMVAKSYPLQDRGGCRVYSHQAETTTAQNICKSDLDY